METFPNLTIYSNIYNQLKDIHKEIIEEKKMFTKTKVFDRYTLGTIAVKNFDSENDPYAIKLMYIFGLSYKFSQLPLD